MDRRNIGGQGGLRGGGLDVSLVGLGCNAFGARVDEKGTHAVIDAALAAGIDFLDTAEAKFSFQVQHRYASELRWEFTIVSSTLMSVTSFIVSGRTVESFERSAA